MDYLPDDIFNDLMLDLVGKYNGPPIAASDLQGLSEEPQCYKLDHTHKERNACEGFPAHRGLEPQEEVATSIQLPKDDNEQAADRPSAWSSLDSRKYINSQGHADSPRSSIPAENNALPSDSRSVSLNLHCKKGIISTGSAGFQQSSSPAEKKEKASNSHPLTSSLDSRKDPSSLKQIARWQSVSPGVGKEQATISHSVSLSLDSRKDASSLKRTDNWHSGSPAESKGSATNNRDLSLSVDSRKDTSLPKHPDHWRSCNPIEHNEQASNSHYTSLCFDSRNDTSSLKHADRRRSSSPVESKGQASDSRLELRGGDHRKDHLFSGHADRWRASNSAESKKQVSNSHSEFRANRASHTDERFSHSYEKKKNGAADVAMAEGSLSKEEAAHRTQDKGRKAKGDDHFQRLKERMGDPDFLNICGKQLIKWADLATEHSFKSDLIRCNLQTETFKSLITAFKCPPTPEHHQYCFSRVGECLHHPTFKSPSLDRELFGICSASDDTEASEKFVKKIYPLDKDLEKIQHLIMMATIPLFLVCNAYEVDTNPAPLRPALMSTVLMCRHSLVLFGQIFSLISSLRQERVLDALSLPGKPPQPSRFPNLDSECLFGQDYMAKLSLFMEKNNLLAAGGGATPRKEEDIPEVSLKDLDKQVDAKTKVTIEKLARFVAEMGLEMEAFNMNKLTKNPNFWFLNSEQSPAYKLYQTKLSVFRQSFGLSDSSKQQDGQSKEPKYVSHQPLQKGVSSLAATPTDCFTAPLLPPPRKRKATLNYLAVSTKRVLQEETPKVDAKTRDTAEKLARFIVRMGPEMERFTKAEASNPEFWFLNQKDHPAYKFYQMKFEEFSKAKQPPSGVSSPKTSVPEKSSTVEKSKLQNPGPQNPAGSASEPHSALLLLSELYDSDEEDSKSDDRLLQSDRHQDRRHHKSRRRTDSLSRDSKQTSSKHDSRVGIR